MKKSSGSSLVDTLLVLGVIALIIGIIAVGYWFMNRDSKLETTQFTPIIFDDAQLIDQNTHSWLTSFNYPQGFAFIIHTVNSLPEKYIGLEADDLFEADIKRCSNVKACKKRGVYIVLSKKPALMQVRTGSDFYLQARWAGITAGEEYISQQQVGSNANESLSEMVEWLASSLPSSLDLPWYKKNTLVYISKELMEEIEDLSLPSEGFYGDRILKTFLKIRIFELHRFKTWWMTFVVAALFAKFFTFFIQLILTAICALFKLPTKIANSITLIFSIILSLGVAIPSISSMIILSGARLEDQIALHASGIPGATALSFPAELYNVETGFWIALLIIFPLRMLKGLLPQAWMAKYAFLPAEQQQQAFQRLEEYNPVAAFAIAASTVYGSEEMVSAEDFAKEPFTNAGFMAIFDNAKFSLYWFLLAWLTLPLAFSMAAIYFWLTTIIPSLFSAVINLLSKSPVAKSKGSAILGSMAAVIAVVAVVILTKEQNFSIIDFVRDKLNTQSWSLQSQNSNETGYVNKCPFVNLRRQPDPTSSLIRKVDCGTEVTVLGEAPSHKDARYTWHYIQLQGGQKGWMYAGANKTWLQQSRPSGNGIVATQTDPLNIRKGPGYNYEKVGLAQKGERLFILEKSGDWYKVRLLDGTVGYAYGKYIKAIQ